MNIKLKSDRGFSPVEAILILLIIVAISGIGYWVYSQRHKSQTAVINSDSPTLKASAPAGTTDSIDNLTTQDAKSESGIDSKYSSGDQTTVKNTNSPAANIGGAYDESTY